VFITSPSEAVFRGGQFDTFSVVVSTSEMRLDATTLVQMLADGATVASLAEACAAEASATSNVIRGDLALTLEQSLDRLVDVGVVRRVPAGSGAEAWGAFRRFGTLHDGWADHVEFDVVGRSSAAAGIADVLIKGGAEVSMRSFAEAADQPLGEPREAETRRIAVAVAVDDPVVDLHTYNKSAVSAGVDVLWVQASGRLTVVGPLTLPGRTPCYWEWERAFARSLFEQDHYRAGRRSSVPLPTAPAPTSQMAVTAVLPALVELAAFGEMAEPSTVLFADAAAPSMTSETCLRLPRCPVCAGKRAAVRTMFP
jgi:bacteriocin biosynthesis cyclodehydratase domain-containing protein